jgi:hypothetical protein
LSLLRNIAEKNSDEYHKKSQTLLTPDRAIVPHICGFTRCPVVFTAKALSHTLVAGDA